MHFTMFQLNYTLENNSKFHLPNTKIPKTFFYPGPANPGTDQWGRLFDPGSKQPGAKSAETAGGSGRARRRRAAPRR